MFEFSHSHLAGLRVINEYRNNRITVDFQARDGQDDDTMADTATACIGPTSRPAGAGGLRQRLLGGGGRRHRRVAPALRL